jgi:hypothetical protein
MAITKEIIIKADTTNAVSSVDNLSESIDGVSDSAEKLSENVEGVNKDVKIAGKTGKKAGTDLDKGFKQGAKGVNNFKVAVKGVGLALKAAGIGLAIAALLKFQDLFLGDKVTDSLTLAAETINNIFKGQNAQVALENAKETLRLQKEIQINEKRLEKFQLGQQELAEKQRQIRDDVSKSIVERIDANTQLSVILEKQLSAEKQLAQISLDFARTENEKKGTQESYLALLDAEIKIAEINERITSQRSEQKVNEVGLQLELNQLKETEGRLTNNIFSLDKAKGIQLLENNKKRAENEFNTERTILDNRLLLLEEGTQAYADTLLERQDLTDNFNINSLIADKEISDEKIKLARNVENAKLNIAFQTSALIGQLVEKDSALGKSLAVAQATISGFQGAQNAFTTASLSPITSVFPAYPFIQAGLAGAFSALQIKNILSTNPKTGKGASGGGVGSGGGQSAPAFNLVAGTGSNQIAESLANQDQPLQAFVVSGEVTSGQALDRNIINNSSL